MIDPPTSELTECSVRPSVTLVIPGRNCQDTLRRCLDSVLVLLESGELNEIIFVDDGSTDSTLEIAQCYPIVILSGKGQGPGAARNIGWTAAESELIWFIDSDCVADPDALSRLRAGLLDDRVAGVGGSYSNLLPDSILATMIHEEIRLRHRRMPCRVDFLATFNVLYRRSVLSEVGGFDESLKLAQDAELSYRIRAHGYLLGFQATSTVGHHHPTNLFRYLRTQARQGYYRVALYRMHPNKIKGDSYASLIDYAQPPLGMTLLVAFCIAPWIGWKFLGACLVTLLVLQLPLTVGMIGWTRPSMAGFLLLGPIRAIARGLGMTRAVLSGVE